MQYFILNGWASSPRAWDLCKVCSSPKSGDEVRIFSYVEQLEGLPEKAAESAREFVLVGWSMGGSSALRLAMKYPEKVRALVLVAATPRMLEDKENGWRGMSLKRLDALKRGLELTRGEGFFGIEPGKINPYLMDSEENLRRGLKYLVETDLRKALEDSKDVFSKYNFPVAIFQSENDGIVRSSNAHYLAGIFAGAKLTIVKGSEHALSIIIPEMIDSFLEDAAGRVVL
jgi:pimeloyl-[acyl-carrier protein] methyl ester esterase